MSFLSIAAAEKVPRPHRADVNVAANANARWVARWRHARSSLSDRSMIVMINRVDKNCLPPSDIAVRKHLAPPDWWPSTRRKRILHVNRRGETHDAIARAVART